MTNNFSLKVAKVANITKLFVCKNCDFFTSKKCNYEKHLSSYKHIQKEAYLRTRNVLNYDCSFCGYHTTIKYNYEKHLSSLKHNKNVSTTSANVSTTSANVITTSANVSTTSANVSTTSENVSTTSANVSTTSANVSKNDILDKEIIKNDILYSSIMSEIKNLMNEQHKMILDTVSNNPLNITNMTNMTNINNNKQNNQQFNMNVFLNETCKDAMNMSDFIQNLHVSMEDMEKTGELGFIKGMSRIIMNNLNAIDVCKRPIHCSDSKRETLYVKNNGVWEKETEERKRTKEIIYKVSCLNARQLVKWRDLPQNKGYEKSDHPKNDEFISLVMEINKMRDEEIDKVITTISKHVTIDKVKMSGYLK
jgi:hypothetical protein